MVVVAQLVRASVCGTEGRGFESHLPPHNEKVLLRRDLFLFITPRIPRAYLQPFGLPVRAVVFKSYRFLWFESHLPPHNERSCFGETFFRLQLLGYRGPTSSLSDFPSELSSSKANAFSGSNPISLYFFNIPLAILLHSAINSLSYIKTSILA